MSPTFVKCPTCGRELEWRTAEFRPFCSERCRLIDLGAWFSEQHAIPGESAPAEAGEQPGDPTAEGSDP